MEARAQYGPWQERPRLTVVHDGGASYSALPHDIVFSDLTDGEVRMYAVVQSYAWGDEGECTASHATLAARTGKKERTIRALLASLVAKGYLTERHHGRGQGKAYRPCVPTQSGRNLPVSEPKRQISASQAAEICQPKRQKSAAPIEEDEVKKILEELPPTEVGAAGAASPPATVRRPKKSSRPGRTGDETPCPDAIDLTEQSYETAAKWGFDRAAVDFQLETFMESARANGRVYVDWKAAFKTWLLKEVQFAKRDNRPVGSRTAAPRTNGRSDMPPPGAASKQTSSWADFKGRHGGNLVRRGADDGR